MKPYRHSATPIVAAVICGVAGCAAVSSPASEPVSLPPNALLGEPPDGRGAPTRALHRSISQGSSADGIICSEQAKQGGIVVCRAPVGGQQGVEIWHDGKRVSRGSAMAVMGLRRNAPSVLTIRAGADPARLSLRYIRVAERKDPQREIDGFDCDKVDARTPEQKAHAGRSWSIKQKAFARVHAPVAEALSFAPPADGPISGHFGPSRVYRGVSATGKTCKKTSVHRGMDIAAPVGSALTAPLAGTVILAQDDLYYEGGTIFLDHGWGLVSVFMHMSSVGVAVGQRVAGGERLGASGATGRVTGPHVHWGVKWRPEESGQGVYIDPEILLELR